MKFAVFCVTAGLALATPQFIASATATAADGAAGTAAPARVMTKDEQGDPAKPKLINRAPAPAETAPVAAAAAPVAAPRPVAATDKPVAATATAATGSDGRPGSDPASPSAEPSDTSAATDAKKSVANAPVKSKAKPITLAITVDLPNQRAHVSVNGSPTHTWPISSGRFGYETPAGKYRPQWMSRMWYSQKYELSPMPHSVFFHDGIAFHGTQYAGSLGRPASHGCVRLAPRNAETLYKLVQKHGMAATRITVEGRAPIAVSKRATGDRRMARASGQWDPYADAMARQRRLDRRYGRQGGYAGGYPPGSGYYPSYRSTWPGDSPRRGGYYGW